MEDIYGNKAIGQYLGIENQKIMFKIDGTGKTQAFNPKVIDKITISETGEIVDRKKIFNLAGIEYTEKESETTDRETLPKPQKTISTTYNPCEDELFIKIKQKELDEMSDREYEYFYLKLQECREFNQNKRTPTEIVNSVGDTRYTGSGKRIENRWKIYIGGVSILTGIGSYIHSNTLNESYNELKNSSNSKTRLEAYDYKEKANQAKSTGSVFIGIGASLILYYIAYDYPDYNLEISAYDSNQLSVTICYNLK